MSSQSVPKNASGSDHLSSRVTSVPPECTGFGQHDDQHSLDVAVTMALPPSSGDEEPCHKDSQKRMVHNEVERRRKVKINNYIANLAKLLPNKDGRKWSKNETLQKAVDYINEVKEAHEKMLLGRVDEVHAVELTRLKRRIEELEKQNSNYEKLFALAGISPDADPQAVWKQSKDSPAGKIDPELVVMGKHGDVIVLSPQPSATKNSDVGGTANDRRSAASKSKCKAASAATDSKKKRKTSFGSTRQQSSGDHDAPTNADVYLPPQDVVSVGLSAGSQCHTSANITSTWLSQMADASSCCSSSSSSVGVGATLPVVTHETLITQATNCVTAVTQTLPGGPIMSTSQSSTPLQQHQQQQATAVVSQLPLLNFGAPVSVMQAPMQPVITINEQGIPVLQMVATQQPAPSHQQLGAGPMIVNGHAGQNLMLTRDSTALECQAAGHSQGILHADAGIFQQAVGQFIGSHPAARYVPQLAQSAANASSSPQVQGPGTGGYQLVTPAVSMPQMIQTHGGNVVLGATHIQGSQQGNAMLTVNPSSTSNGANLPSALMLPNGQIIPVVREPSLIYSNAAPLNGNLLMTAAPSVSQAMLSSSGHLQQQQQPSSQAGAANLHARTLAAGGGIEVGTAVQMSSGSQAHEGVLAQQTLGNALTSTMLSEMIPGQRGTPPRPISASSAATPDLQASVAKPQENAVSSTIVSQGCVPGGMTAAARGSKKPVARKAAHRVIKPKPIVTTATSTVTNTKAKKKASSAGSNAGRSSAGNSLGAAQHSVTSSVSKSPEAAKQPGQVTPTVDIERPGEKRALLRPSSRVTDILAQATESIFANSASDSVSPTSSSGFCVGNGGDSVDCMQVVGASHSPLSSQMFGAPCMLAETGGVKVEEVHGKDGDKRIGGDSDTQQQSGGNHAQSVDILSDLVCEVYRTTGCASPVTTLSTVESSSSSCALGLASSNCRTEETDAEVSVAGMTTTSSKPSPELSNLPSSNVEMVLDEPGMPTDSSAPLPLNPVSVPFECSPNCQSGPHDIRNGDSRAEQPKTPKRGCTYEESATKRLRDDGEMSMESLMPQSSKKEDAAAIDSRSSPASNASPAGVSTASCGVSFVSVSQLASSSSSSAAPANSSSVAAPSCSVTFTSTPATSVASSFSIDTAISNVSSPLCSISPLLSSPNNKSNDLSFSLGAAISDLARSDDASSGLGMDSCGSTAGSQSSFAPTSFAPSSMAPSPNFGLPDLGSLNAQQQQQANFRTTYHVAAAGPPSAREDFNGIADGQSPLSNPAMDKGMPKTHSMHYVQHGEGAHLHQQQQQLHIGSADVLAHHRGPLTGSHTNYQTLQPLSSQIGSQVPSFCQGYSTPLTHHSGHPEPLGRPSVASIGHHQNEPTPGAGKTKPAVGHHRRMSNNEVTMVTSPPNIQLQRSQSVHLCPDGSQMNGLTGAHNHRQTSTFAAHSSRMHSLNHQSPQGGVGGGGSNSSNNAHSPKLGGDIHGHSPMGGSGGGPHSVSSSASTSPKPGMPRSHSATSPGRNTLPTPPVSSPASFVPHCSPSASTVDTQMIDGYSVDGQNAFRDLNLAAGGHKRLNHHQASPGAATMNQARTTISYSAESLIQTQPRHRPNCAREGQSMPPMPRNAGGGSGAAAVSVQGSGSQPTFLQNPPRVATSVENVQHAPFPYFGLPQSAVVTSNNEQLRPQIGMPMPPTSMGMPLKHASPTQSSGGGGTMGKQCLPRGVSEAAGAPVAIQTQPNFSFSLMQHAPMLGCGDPQLPQHPHHHHHHQRVHSAGPDANNLRHNNYFPMSNYASQMGAAMPPGLQCASAHKNGGGQSNPPQFHHHHASPSFTGNQAAGGNGQMPNIRGQVLGGNAYIPQNGGVGVENGSSAAAAAFMESSPYQVHGSLATIAMPNVPAPTKGTGHYKSKGGGGKQDGSATKSSKSKQQNSRKKHQQQQQQQLQQQQQQQQQYTMEEVNLSNSIFETGRSMTPYFSISNLSPPRNEAPTYIPSTNPLFNAAQRGVAPNAAVQQQQSKATSDLSGAPYNPLFAPRGSQGGTLNLNFQAAPGFGVNHLHHGNGGAVPNQIAPPHGPSGVPPPHVPNFNLSNIFPDINGSGEGLNISNIKFHHPGNHILPPPTHQSSSGMDHNLQHHQSGPLYHNRGHPPPPPPAIHNGMTINSLLGHNPHGFDGRPQVSMSINNTMTPPFHGHGHTASFSNVIPTLNFSMHDH